MCESEFLARSFATFLINFSLAAIAILFAFLKFRKEKWWDKSFQCHMDTIDTINDLIQIADEIIQFNNNVKIIERSEVNKLSDKFIHCKIKLGGIATVGKLLLSKKGHDLLLKFDAMLYAFDISNADDHAVAVIRDNAEAYLTEFIQISKFDLHKNFLSIQFEKN